MSDEPGAAWPARRSPRPSSAGAACRWSTTTSTADRLFIRQGERESRLGTCVLHEGVTPEYKGLRSSLWALLKNEPEYIGYTLLRVDDTIDGGEILSRARYVAKTDERVRQWSYVGHQAIVDNLPHIESALRQLELNGGCVPVDIGLREKGYYSWMRLISFLRACVARLVSRIEEVR